MSILIIESIGRPIEADFSKTSVAHARNAVIVANILGADLITGEKDMHITDGKTYDHIICSYASPYMKYKKLIGVVDGSPDAQLWWLVNDHDLEDNILLRNVLKNSEGKRTFKMLCNNPREGYRGWIRRKKIKNHDGELLGLLDEFITDWHTLNLNSLIYNEQEFRDHDDRVKSCVYWGSFRKWRLDDFIEYGNSIVISATPRTSKKFKENGVHSYFVDKLSWQDGVCNAGFYTASLYIEDEHTHENYAYMANRYYEALMCGLPTFFDEKCRKNVEKSGFVVNEWAYVRNHAELEDKISQIVEDENLLNGLIIADAPNRSQARFERAEVVGKIRELFLTTDAVSV